MVYCLLSRDTGANGQGKSVKEARQSLSEAIALILEDRRTSIKDTIPKNAVIA